MILSQGKHDAVTGCAEWVQWQRPEKEVAMQLPRLRECRERALLTQAELAEKAGVSEVTINRLENGRHAPRFSTVRKLAAALGVPPTDLMAPAEAAEQGKAAA